MTEPRCPNKPVPSTSTLCVVLALCAGFARVDAAAAQDLEVVAELPGDIPPGNVAVTPNGRVILSLHQFFGPSPYRVVELLPTGTVVPFPTEAWARPPGPDGVGVTDVLGVNSDANGVVWMLDNGGDDQSAKLVAWSTALNRLERVVYLGPPATRDNSFLNDLAIDPLHGFVALADTARGPGSAVVVVDLATGQAVRRLEGHPALSAEDLDMVVDGRGLALGPNPARVGLNPITIDTTYQHVFLGPMSGSSLYRVATSDLFDLSMSEEDLSERVVRHGDRPICDGITTDTAGNIYVTDFTHNALGVIEPDGTYRVLYRDDPRLDFPNALAVGPGGWIYVTVNQLHRSPPLNGGLNEARPPFYVLRFPALAPTVVGR